MAKKHSHEEATDIVQQRKSNWDGWADVEVTKKGEVKVVPKGRQSKKSSSSSIITDPHGEASQ